MLIKLHFVCISQHHVCRFPWGTWCHINTWCMRVELYQRVFNEIKSQPFCHFSLDQFVFSKPEESEVKCQTVDFQHLRIFSSVLPSWRWEMSRYEAHTVPILNSCWQRVVVLKASWSNAQKNAEQLLNSAFDTSSFIKCDKKLLQRNQNTVNSQPSFCRSLDIQL